MKTLREYKSSEQRAVAWVIRNGKTESNLRKAMRHCHIPYHKEYALRHALGMDKVTTKEKAAITIQRRKKAPKLIPPSRPEPKGKSRQDVFGALDKIKKSLTLDLIS
jgi:hypothetical protein